MRAVVVLPFPLLARCAPALLASAPPRLPLPAPTLARVAADLPFPTQGDIPRTVNFLTMVCMHDWT